MAELDSDDRKLLALLDENSRLSVKKIAKGLRESEQFALYRLNRLLENGTIRKFITLIDHSKLGLISFKIFIDLQGIGVEKESELLDFLAGLNNTAIVSTCEGNYDLLVEAFCETQFEFYELFTRLSEKFGKFFRTHDLCSVSATAHFPKSFITGAKKRQPSGKLVFFKSSKKIVKFNDLLVLKQLSQNARMPISEISAKTGLSPETVSSRISFMLREKVILGFKVLIDRKAFGVFYFKALVFLKNYSRKRVVEFFDYCSAQPGIVFFSSGIGRWDLEVDVETFSVEAFHSLMLDIKKEFSDLIRDYHIILMLQSRKHDFMPLVLD